MTDWRDRAACVGLPSDWFFSPPSGTPYDPRSYQACAECVVRVECAGFAVAADCDEGVWGGLAPGKRGRRVTPPRVLRVNHGTAGYRRGCRCDECRWADRLARERRRLGGVPDWVHGTEGGYHNWGCRCDACCEARSVVARRRYVAKRETA